MRIKQNGQVFRLAYHSSGSLNGSRPKYFYLDGIDSEGSVMGLIGPDSQKPLANSKHELVQVARRLIRGAK